MREKKKPLFGRHTVQILYCTVLTEGTTVASLSDNNLYIRTLPWCFGLSASDPCPLTGPYHEITEIGRKLSGRVLSLFVQEKF
jgi:hypothetical protein